MKKIISLMSLCILLSVSAPSFAEQSTAEAPFDLLEVVFEDFTVVAGRVTKKGDKYVIRLSADFTGAADAGEYVFFLTPTDETGKDLPGEGIVDAYGFWWTHDHVCYVSFKALDGEAFIDWSKDAEFRVDDATKQPDGTWRREMKLECSSRFTNAEGVVLEFHVFDGKTPYSGEAQGALSVKLE